ncbi:MAG TPA: CHAT domain-containing protein [Pyrinomonadaceae bacterium]|nr:CHAT domain-containing protein [Pyrinomonadaceae bacterium]
MAQAEETKIREYLLGQLTEAEEEQVELRLLTEPDFAEEYDIVVNEITDDYIAGKFEGEELKRLEEYFFTSIQRRDKLKFALALNKRNKGRIKPPKKNPFTRYLAIAASFVLLAGGGLYLWQVSSNNSDLNRGLAALQSAFRDERPLEARISKFDYAPYSTTRGPGPEKVHQDELRRAELTLLDAVKRNPTPAVHHGLGKVYLAKKQFDEAIKQFDEALKSDPNNPQIFSDLGAARLEAGQQANLNQESGKGFALLAQSFADITRALNLDPNLLEALYNKALCLEQMKLPEKAKSAWQDYIERDPRSKWAEEANRHLHTILEGASSSQTAPQLLEGFLAAFREHNDEGAWRILSQNRELITGKMIPPQLERGYLSAVLANQDNNGQVFKRALTYAGELDLKRGGDPYTRDLARYYLSAGPDQHQLLAKALEKLDQGYKLCLATDYGAALGSFEQAEILFTKAGNICEANLAKYWISYCDTQLDRISQSLASLQKVAAYCRGNNYNWLLAQADEWMATDFSSLSQHSDSIKYHELSLDLASTISDTYQMQRSLTALGNEHAYLHQEELSLGYYYRSLSVATDSISSPRQAWRNLLYATSALFTFKHYEAALAFGDEALSLGQREFHDPSLSYMLHLQLGQIYSRLQRFDDAINQTNEGLQIAQSVADQTARQKSTAAAFLKQAQILRESGNNERALRFYDNAITLYEAMKFDLYRYVAYKGRLLTSLALGDDAAVERGLPQLLKMFERSRIQIREEQYRNSFFDTEQGVYDIAIDHAYEKKDLARAVQYAEQSHGRALLDALYKTTHVETTAAGNDRVSSRVVQPLDAESIRQQLPDKLTVLMFTVLSKKLLIWTISRAGISVVEREIAPETLKDQVLNYAQALSQRGSGLTEVLGKELYAKLLGPVSKDIPSDNRLCIIPDKFLCYLPFGALTSPQTGRYLIEDWAVFYAPSINVLWECTRAANEWPHADQGSIVSIGNPNFDRVSYPMLRPLTAAEREASAISHAFRSSICLLGPDANKETVLRAMQSSEIIHFAGHYVVDDSNPLQSRMLLAAPAQGPAGGTSLSASEIAQHRFDHAKLIVLSACQTGLEGYYDGEGSVGLARAFIEARIPLVVASQWAVDSDSTADLMISLYRHRAAGLSTANALRAAQLEMLAGQNETHRDPAYWAGFVCIGGYTEY